MNRTLLKSTPKRFKPKRPFASRKQNRGARSWEGMRQLAKLDHAYVWHPFTQMRDWLKQEPIVIVKGKGALLEDSRRRKYLDANSSIWTNLHGHNHPQINAAIRRQLRRIAHSSALGLANEPASLLAQALVTAANPFVRPTLSGAARSSKAKPWLGKVFFSDDGSTALEVALKLAFEFSRRSGRTRRPRFLSLVGAYHGDTVGAVSLGHIDLFHKAYAPLLFKTDQVMAPYCYRCPFNRAMPERTDARAYRKCQWECLGQIEKKISAQKRKGNSYAGFVFEPLMQGAAGMIPQPNGWLRQACQLARSSGALLIADEVMTGFGRTGSGNSARLPTEPRRQNPLTESPSLFASHQEGVQPDFLALAKGLSGGCVPLAATLTTQAVFNAFLGEYEEFKTFFHGHSFTANQIGSAAGLASLELLQSSAATQARAKLEQALNAELEPLWQHPCVGDIRQVGLIVGIELVRNWQTRSAFDIRERAGMRVCEAMARRGVLTRAIGSVIVLMPPYCTTPAQVSRMVGALRQSIAEIFGQKRL